MQQTENNESIILFDGVCNLCSGFVQFVLRYEKTTDIKFASLQSQIGNSIIKNYQVSQKGLESIVFIENNKAYEKSDAVLRISKYLKFPLSLISAFIILPRFIRDSVYDLVAANRYRLFGKKEVCWLPQPQWKKRFIDSP